MSEFIIHIENGQITNKKVAAKYFSELEDGRYKVTIVKSNKRSLPQNSWLHGVLPDIVKGLQDVGYYEIKTTEQAKDVLKSLFFKKTVSNGSDDIEVIEGTSKVSKEDFSSKAEEIIVWCMDYLGINVAPPGRQTEFFNSSND